MKYFFTNEITHALFYTLVHSLWQGLALAMIAGAVLMFTKKSTPAFRYNSLCILLIIFIACNLITFYYELKLADEYASSKLTSLIAAVTINVPGSAHIDRHPISVIGRIIQTIKPYENLIVFAWFVIIFLKCTYLVAGFKQIHVLKNRQVTDAGEYWNNRVKEFARRIGVKKPVTLMRSALAKIPMVTGHLKPVILIPASLLTALPKEETEAILLHELAHIRRKDYLVNMLQNIIDIIFFFNPAALWISSKIKEERENCCDDIAINVIQNKKQFIHALVSFQEYKIDVTKYAAYFPGSKNYLLQRAKRIITNNNKTLTNMEKIFLVSGLMITGVLMASFTYTKQIVPGQKETIVISVNKTISNRQADTLSPKTGSKNTISTSFEGKQYKIIEQNGKVTELYINDKKIPDKEITQYASTIDKIRQQAKEQMDKQIVQMKLQQKALIEKQTDLMKQKELLMKAQLDSQDQMKLLQEKLIASAEMTKQKELLNKMQAEQKVELMKLQNKVLLEKQADLTKEKELLMKVQVDKENEQMEILKKELLEKYEMDQKEPINKELLNNQNDQIKQLKDSFEKESEQMKLKNKELMNQVDQLKRQLQLMNKKKQDSLYQEKPTIPKSQVKPMKSNTTDIAINLYKNKQD
ncbi:MAG TPA: M56 family metallopeptidase [Parafilimonas sp.]|nr:M56 family metallopeptidase [Parafilimonas sp.]